MLRVRITVMKKISKPLVIGNWKMNPPTVNAAKRLFSDIKKGTYKMSGVQLVVAPPPVFLGELKKIRNGSKKVALCAQSMHWEVGGAYTGEVSAAMLKDLAVGYVIIGHSERRATGITDEQVNKKIIRSIKSGFVAVVCVGERKRDSHGDYLKLVEKQIREGLKGVTKTKLSNIVIAYEPIWAIGTGETATPEDAHEMKLFIQKILADIYGRNFINRVRVIYGGSVNSRNAEDLMKDGTVDGFLVGGASLKPAEFIKIANIFKS